MSMSSSPAAPIARPFPARWPALSNWAAVVERRTGLALLAGLTIVAGLTAVRGLDLPLLAQARLAVFDSYQRLSPRPAPATPVKIIDIDDRSLAEIGQWPWPRHRLADLVDRLTSAGAAAIAFDMVFAEPDRMAPSEIARMLPGAAGAAGLAGLLERLPNPDRRFRDAIARSPVVLGMGLVDRPTDRAPELMAGMAAIGPDPLAFLRPFSGAVANLPMLEGVARGQGSFSVTADADDVIRRVPLVQTIEGRIVPSLAVEALRVAQGASTLGIRSRAVTEAAAAGRRAGLETLRVGQVDVPVDPDGHVWMHYRTIEPERTLSASSVLDPNTPADALREAVEGHILLIGTSAVGLKDLRSTPLNPFEAGVAIHAGLLEQMLTGWFLTRPDWIVGLEVGGSALLGFVLAVALLLVGPGMSALLGAGSAVAVGAASWMAFEKAHILADPTFPLLTLASVHLTVSLITHIFAERDKHAIRTAFTHYLAPAIVSRLAEDPARLKLGGETREMTFLFSDIAGFTTFTERTAPETLVRLLNRYLDGQCGIVMDHGGTVDKIVGDAVHAIFNAPLDQSDHALRAVRCALEMDAFGRAFVAEQAASGLEFGRTRIGVNTGMAVIGNFGGSRRFDYTAHGDAINTAARLEGVNKYFDTHICVAGSTAADCPDIDFRPIGDLVLKGKETAIPAFEPTSGAEAGYAELSAYRKAFDDMENGAGDEFLRLETLFPSDPLVRLHAARVREGVLGTTIVMKDK